MRLFIVIAFVNIVDFILLEYYFSTFKFEDSKDSWRKKY